MRDVGWSSLKQVTYVEGLRGVSHRHGNLHQFVVFIEKTNGFIYLGAITTI